MPKPSLPLRMRRFLNEQHISCKASSVGTYRSALGNFHAFLRASLRVDRVTSEHLAAITEKTLDRYLANLHAQRLAPYSRVNKFLAVKKYLAWEVHHGALPQALLKNFDRSRLPRVPDYLPRPLSKATERVLLDRLRTSDSPYAKAFLLLRFTGLRISELINLSHDCILTTARNEHFLKVPLGKMNNERLVPLCDETLDIIQHFKAAPGLGPRPHDRKRLIGIRGHVPQVYGHLAWRFKKLTADLIDQNKRVTFHRLRHTYATTLLSGGVSIVSIMKLLGHRRIEMSLRYALITPTHLRDEYLKALASLEHRYRPVDETQIPQHQAFASPHAIVASLAAFIKKHAALDAPATANLMKRLHRLRDDIHGLNLPTHFPILSP